MPPAIIGAAINAAVAVVIGLGITAAVKIFFASLVLGLLSSAFAKQPKPGALVTPRTITVRQARAPRRLVVGRAWLGGTVVYLNTSPGGPGGTEPDKTLHLVIALCDGPIDRFGAVRLDGNLIPPENILPDGTVAFGRYAGVVQIKLHTGTVPQEADADLVTEFEEWTEDHRLDGIAYIYVKLTRDDAAFPSGIPNVSAEVFGQQWFDPRDSQTRWTANAALVQRGWLTNAGWGLGADAGDVDDTVAQASANVCDEMVPVTQVSDPFEARRAAGYGIRTTFNIPWGSQNTGQFKIRPDLADGRTVTFSSTGTLPAPLVSGTAYRARVWTDEAFTIQTASGADVLLQDTGTGTHTMHYTERRRHKDEADTVTNYEDTVEFAAAANRLMRISDPLQISWRHGDRVQLETDGSLPSPLSPATDYYVMPDADGGFRLATSVADAWAGTAIALTTNGSGSHTVTRFAEVRYTANGMIEASQARGEVFRELMKASAGRPIWTGGAWRLGVGAAGSSQVSLTADDILGPVVSTTRVPRSDRFNAIGGGMFDSMTGQPVNYPEVASATFQANDNGERIFRAYDLPFTDSPAMAQRLAKIELLRMRQEIGVEFTASMKALAAVADEWCDITLASFGWTAKNFVIEQWQMTSQADDNGNPLLVIRLSAHETDATIFDWSTSEEQVVDPAPNTDFPNPFIIEAPDGLMVMESLYETRDGAGVKARATLTWANPTDGFVQAGGFYRIQARFETETEWTNYGRADVESFIFDDIGPGIWEFRVQAVNRLGGSSGWSDFYSKELLGLLAPPADPANLQLQQVSAMAIISWDRHPDLDVRIGGRIRVRWSPAETGATWITATEATDAPVPGDATQAIVPLRTGTYLVRAYDSSGVPSTGVATISSRAAEHLGFTTLSTITEHPTFAGAKSGVLVDGSVLKLAGAGLFDDIPDFDALVDLDSYGGVALSGTYDFFTGFDFGSVKTVRITATVAASGVNTLDKIDSREALIDTWEDFDGTLSADADTQVWFRETDDDPAGAPSWSAYKRLTAADRNCRGMQFQARLAVTDPAYNEEVSQLSVKAEEIV